jgi:hypothetical protein
LLSELHALIAGEIAELFALSAPGAGSNLVPAPLVDDPGFKVAIADNARLFGVEAEVYVGDEVPGGMMVLSFPRPVVVLSRPLFTRPDRERRFLLGRAFESLRGGYAALLRLSPRERAEVGTLLRSLFLPDGERPAATQELVRQLPRKTQKALERFVMPGLTAAALAMPPSAAQGAGARPLPQFGATAAQAHGGARTSSVVALPSVPGASSGTGASELLPNPESWLGALAQAQDRAGILACDDFAGAARALAILSGEEIAVTQAMSQDGAVALGAIPGGSDLVRYFLSDDYHRLRAALTEPAGPSSAVKPQL